MDLYGSQIWLLRTNSQSSVSERKLKSLHTRKPRVLMFLVDMTPEAITSINSCVIESRPPFQTLRKFLPCLLKEMGGAFFGWLTCLPPFFGLCWAPPLGPAQHQALQVLPVPVGGPGPDAHRQPCSRLKGEARQLNEVRWWIWNSRLHTAS